MKFRSVIFLAASLCASTANSNVLLNKQPLYSLQLFSSTSPVKAEGIKNTLQVDGYNAWINESKANQQTVYRVHVGQLQSRNAALGLRIELTNQYASFPFVSKCFVKKVKHEIE